MSYKIIYLDNEQVTKYWPTIAIFLNNVLEHGHGESTLADYLKKILNQQVHCWAIIDDDLAIKGAGLTQFIQYSQYKTLHIIAFSGLDFEEQSKVFPTVEQFARDTGCKAIEEWGRPGWAKALPKYVPGFKQAYVVMRKDLE